MKNTRLKFPRDFLWGAAISSHQTEGGNTNDWTEWEKQNASRLAKKARVKFPEWQQEKFPEMFDPKNYISGSACDHYNQFQEDFDIAKELGLNAFRLSFEWSRLEPEQGKFDEKEIAHYKEVIRALKERNLEPFVTLWHWTLPLWAASQGGLKNRQFKYWFSRYAEKIAQEFQEDIKFWITLNEPDFYALACYSRGSWPPQEKSFYSFLRVYMNLVWAHRAAYGVIKEVSPSTQIGLAKDNIYFEARPRTLLNVLLKKCADFFGNYLFLNKTRLYSDFIGLNYYHHNTINKGLRKNENKIVSDLGWELYPEGIYHVLKDLERYKQPIYVTENGLADQEDTRRQWFIEETLNSIQKARDEGVDIRGYFHWSLLDNFEWDKGFWPKFGLVEINPKTKERKIRPSAYFYKDIIARASS